MSTVIHRLLLLVYSLINAQSLSVAYNMVIYIVWHIFPAVSDVERRSRSLRTQYGRVLWHPERVSTVQQKMLRDKLDFLRPYIVRRRGDSYLVSLRLMQKIL